MGIRKLLNEDANAFYELRLRALRECPSAFSESAEEFQILGGRGIAARMEASRDSGGFILGAYSDNSLCGSIGLLRETKAKTKHHGSVWGVYVTPEARGTGLGKRLLTELIEEVKRLGLVQIKLSVESENVPAIRLYERLGFVSYGVEPRALKVDGKYFSETHMLLVLSKE